MGDNPPGSLAPRSHSAAGLVGETPIALATGPSRSNTLTAEQEQFRNALFYYLEFRFKLGRDSDITFVGREADSRARMHPECTEGDQDAKSCRQKVAFAAIPRGGRDSTIIRFQRCSYSGGLSKTCRSKGGYMDDTAKNKYVVYIDAAGQGLDRQREFEAYLRELGKAEAEVGAIVERVEFVAEALAQQPEADVATELPTHRTPERPRTRTAHEVMSRAFEKAAVLQSQADSRRLRRDAAQAAEAQALAQAQAYAEEHLPAPRQPGPLEKARDAVRRAQEHYNWTVQYNADLAANETLQGAMKTPTEKDEGEALAELEQAHAALAELEQAHAALAEQHRLRSTVNGGGSRRRTRKYKRRTRKYNKRSGSKRTRKFRRSGKKRRCRTRSCLARKRAAATRRRQKWRRVRATRVRKWRREGRWCHNEPC